MQPWQPKTRATNPQPWSSAWGAATITARLTLTLTLTLTLIARHGACPVKQTCSGPEATLPGSVVMPMKRRLGGRLALAHARDPCAVHTILDTMQLSLPPRHFDHRHAQCCAPWHTRERESIVVELERRLTSTTSPPPLTALSIAHPHPHILILILAITIILDR